MTTSPRLRAPLRVPLCGAAVLLSAATPAFAHHAMDGAVPETFLQGLLSGIAHPVIGLDHLAFVVAVAWILSRAAARPRTGFAALFVAASLAGTALHLQAVDLPASELGVALTVVAAGLVAAWRRLPPAALLGVALVAAGVLHGYAYGESIVGAEATPLAAYLVGFTGIQFVLVTLGATLVARLEPARGRRFGLATGAVVALLGTYFSVTQLPGVLA